MSTTPTPTPAPKPTKTNLVGIIETVLGDSTKALSLIAGGSGLIVAFASKFHGGAGEAGVVMAGIGVAGLVINSIADAIAS